MGPDLNMRNGEELRTLAAVMDAILRGNVPLAMDMLAGRFTAVETAATTKDWSLAKHLQVLPSQRVGCVSGDLLDFAQKKKREEAKSLVPNTRGG